MKKTLTVLLSLTYLMLIMVSGSGCKNTSSHLKYSQGTFPDSVVNIEGINTTYDDYNLALYQIQESIPLIFSSNRGSSGGQFDLVQAILSITFNQETGDFTLQGQMTNDEFLTRLISAANTPGNDFGPYRIFSSLDGFEYMILSSMNGDNGYDFYYLKNQPEYAGYVPEVSGPAPVTLINTSHNEVYLCLNANQDSAYFSSDAGGNYDIYVIGKSAGLMMDAWLSGGHQNPDPVNILNSADDDKCPYLDGKLMVFASNRTGGFGGYDLYYSLFKNGTWTEPVNFGPSINTQYNEFRPVVGGSSDFTNPCMLFSSDRPGGKGGFDIYFTGIEMPE
jgi:hypothetical protein